MEENISIEKYLNNFKKSKIAVIGDLMLDEYLIGEVDRISPEAPVPVVKIKSEKLILGGSANVSNNLLKLGATVIPFGIIGDDESGNKLLDSFDENIDISNIIKSLDRKTTLKRRVLCQNQQLIRLDLEETDHISTELEDMIISNFKKYIETLDAVILSDYNKGTLTPRLSKEIINCCNENNIIVTVDPKPINIANYIGASSITPNKKEAFKCGDFLKTESIENVGKKIKDMYKLKTVLITRSEEGMTLFKDKILNIPTLAKEVYDVTGAGDTVISVFTLAKVSGASWYEAAKIANAAAGIVVGRKGTATVTTDEILDFYNRFYNE